MKTVKRMVPEQDVAYRRVGDNVAATLVQQGWAYCPKQEWKEFVRDALVVKK